ncbi:unnamed protein product [Arctia plantaginis]|uniref:Uncharacterized protein n=1 Tax=Arctia plantaginis TaxID=874455 RepID=A0A8S1A9Z6_ARCPL|nr:unnamed protein product [Arctia plantaginis]
MQFFIWTILVVAMIIGRRLVYCKLNTSLCEVGVLLPKFGTSYTSYLDCIGFKDLRSTLVNGTNSDNDIQNFCGKTPKICSKTMLADAPACPPYINFVNHMTNTIEKVHDYFCFDGGATLKIYLKEGGPNCIKDKENETSICMASNNKQDPSSNYHQIIFSLKDVNCVIQKLKTCNKPELTKIFETVEGIIHHSTFNPVTTPTVNNPNAANGNTLTSGIVLVTLITLLT